MCCVRECVCVIFIAGAGRMSRASCVASVVALRCCGFAVGSWHCYNKDYIRAGAHIHAIMLCVSEMKTHERTHAVHHREEQSKQASTRERVGFMIFQKIDIYCLICYYIYLEEYCALCPDSQFGCLRSHALYLDHINSLVAHPPPSAGASGARFAN